MKIEPINLEATTTEYMDIYVTIYAQDYSVEDHNQYNLEELALEVV